MQKLLIQRHTLCKHNRVTVCLLIKLRNLPRFSYSSMLCLPYSTGLLTDDHMNHRLTIYGEHS